jgi:hypothetical protein
MQCTKGVVTLATGQASDGRADPFELGAALLEHGGAGRAREAEALLAKALAYPPDAKYHAQLGLQANHGP